MTAMLIAAVLTGPPIGYVDPTPYVSVRHVDRRVSVIRPFKERLLRIASCESGSQTHVVSSSGTYRGLLQFDFQTWRSVGGRGDPAAATRREQLYRGARLYRLRGPAPWPICGYV